MKYFPHTTEGIFSSKVNFVDENNRLVGYDFYQSCCESFGWYISSSSLFDPKFSVVDDTYASVFINQLLEGWVFDPKFFEENTNSENFSVELNQATFRLVKDDKELFLHLFNEHNGYYSHGFEFLEEGTTIKSGCL
jgi:hypothetical protein